MARPIVIEFAANVRDFLRGSKDVERATEDIADELKDAGRDAERFEREFRDSMRDAEKAADRSARKMGDDFGRVKGDLGEVGREGSQEFKQNLAEGLSSGNMEDIVQDTLGGVVSGLSGPLGAAAAAMAAAAAVGYNYLRERAEEVTEFVNSTVELWTNEFDLLEGRIDQMAQKRNIADWIEENADRLRKWKPLIDDAGLSYEEVANAFIEGGEELDRIQDKIDGHIEGQSVLATVLDGVTLQYGDITQAIEESRKEEAILNENREIGVRVMDDQLRRLGEMPAAMQAIQDRYNTVVENIRKNPIEVDAKLNWYNVGAGAAYIDPSSGNYSPGHVAIHNLYQRANGGAG